MTSSEILVLRNYNVVNFRFYSFFQQIFYYLKISGKNNDLIIFFKMYRNEMNFDQTIHLNYYSILNCSNTFLKIQVFNFNYIYQLLMTHVKSLQNSGILKKLKN